MCQCWKKMIDSKYIVIQMSYLYTLNTIAFKFPFYEWGNMKWPNYFI